MQQKIKLLTAIREKGWRQTDFAKVVGEHETFVSRVINGWVNLDPARMEKFAKALEMPVEELFE